MEEKKAYSLSKVQQKMLLVKRDIALSTLQEYAIYKTGEILLIGAWIPADTDVTLGSLHVCKLPFLFQRIDLLL